jgi:hypothetical protein
VTANTKHAHTVAGKAGAYGGTGGSGATGGAGGAATASLTLTGLFGVTATANATGGSGGAGAGKASATATGQGASGDANSTATSGSIASGSLVTAASANADAPVAGTSTAKTWAAIGKGAISAPALVADQAVAQITAEPKTTDVNAINAANANINTAFHAGKTPTYFGIGELGGEYATSGSGSETETASVHLTVDLTKGTRKNNCYNFVGRGWTV